MSTPKENPITIRRAGLREKIQAYADKEGLKFNVAAVTLILKGLGPRAANAKPKGKLPRKVRAKAVLAAAEQAVGVAPAALPPPQDAIRSPGDLVPFNPPRAPMQKTKPKNARWGL